MLLLLLLSCRTPFIVVGAPQAPANTAASCLAASVQGPAGWPDTRAFSALASSTSPSRSLPAHAPVARTAMAPRLAFVLVLALFPRGVNGGRWLLARDGTENFPIVAGALPATTKAAAAAADAASDRAAFASSAAITFAANCAPNTLQFSVDGVPKAIAPASSLPDILRNHYRSGATALVVTLCSGTTARLAPAPAFVKAAGTVSLVCSEVRAPPACTFEGHASELGPGGGGALTVSGLAFTNSSGGDGGGGAARDHEAAVGEQRSGSGGNDRRQEAHVVGRLNAYEWLLERHLKEEQRRGARGFDARGPARLLRKSFARAF